MGGACYKELTNHNTYLQPLEIDANFCLPIGNVTLKMSPQQHKKAPQDTSIRLPIL